MRPLMSSGRVSEVDGSLLCAVQHGIHPLHWFDWLGWIAPIKAAPARGRFAGLVRQPRPKGWQLSRGQD
jgi:hypothetical protein